MITALRRFLRRGLVTGVASLATFSATASEVAKIGPAYEALATLPIMHEGRIKPLDTLARTQVKLIHGRETVTIKDEHGAALSTWEPVAAFHSWSMNPDYWDDQPFILVEYLPLKQKLLADAVKAKLAALIASDVPAAVKTQAEALAKLETFDADQLRDLANMQGLPQAFSADLAALAVQHTEHAKFFTPRSLEDARILVDGRRVDFLDWTNDLRMRAQQANDAAIAGLKRETLSQVEKKAIEVADRLISYQHIRGDTQRFAAPVNQVTPRPHSEAFLRYAGSIYRKIREISETADRNRRESLYASLTPLEEDTANTVFRFLKTLQSKNRKEPGTDAEFDRDFTDWLKEDADWTPLPVLLEGNLEDLANAGYPAELVASLRQTYQALKEEELKQPGHASPETARAFVAAARALGESIGGYPSETAIRRETAFNAFAPFYWTPVAYGIGFAFLLLSLCISARPPSTVGICGSVLYGVGMIAFVAGILLEIYGFYSRVRISGWAPVTNMYETVIWVGGVAAVIGLIFEAIYRKRYAATGAAGVAMLATLVAASAGSTILDPSIKSIPPVLRSNYWLTVHVLTIVSSYAAFALAMGIGLIATYFYLTATYRRELRITELLRPLLLGLPLAFIGILGYMAAKEADGPAITRDPSFALASGVLGLIGVSLSLSPLPALIGEWVSRRTFRRGPDLDSAAVAGSSPEAEPTPSLTGSEPSGGGVATLARPSVSVIRATQSAARPKPVAREQAMQQTAMLIKPLATFIYRAMQVGVLLVAAGTILGGVWADVSWGRFWGWDPKEVWALITLLVYLVPLHGRFAGWINTWGLVASSVLCFASVMMAWYGVNFVLGVGLHSYGFSEGGSQELVGLTMAAVFSLVVAAGWRRYLGLRALSPAT